MIKINGVEVKFITYPSNEWGVSNYDEIEKEIRNEETAKFIWKTGKEWEKELIAIKVLKETISQNSRTRFFNISIDFLPNQREDKIENGRIDFFSIMLEELETEFDVVNLDTIHSIKNKFARDWDQKKRHHPMWINKILSDNTTKDIKSLFSESVVIFPDKSASKRYVEYLQTIIGYFTYFTVQKQRDKTTGKIINESIFNEEQKERFNKVIKDAYYKRVIMIDDIMSYGGSFTRIYDEINKIKPNLEYQLFVYGKENHPEVNIDPIKVHYVKELSF